MTKPTLYLMLGYPGAGKTTVSKLIHELTGAVHLWADKMRIERYDQPTHSHKENLELYAHLNEVADELLATGQDVIFDTNFNFYKDRENLRKIAAKNGARCILIWVKAPKELAKERATRQIRFPYKEAFPEARFERISSSLEPPRDDESHIVIDGINITSEQVKQLLG